MEQSTLIRMLNACCVFSSGHRWGDGAHQHQTWLHACAVSWSWTTTRPRSACAWRASPTGPDEGLLLAVGTVQGLTYYPRQSDGALESQSFASSCSGSFNHFWVLQVFLPGGFQVILGRCLCLVGLLGVFGRTSSLVGTSMQCLLAGTMSCSDVATCPSPAPSP